MSTVTLPTPQSPLMQLAARIIGLLESIPYSFLGLAARIFPAAVFWQSGQTKIDGWHLNDSAIALFQDEYKLPLVDPTAAAYAAAFAEHFFPILLLLGLGSRLAAFSLLIMTSIIEIFVYPGAWPTHGVWATCFLLVITRGPGLVSLDHLIARHFGLRSTAPR